MKHHMVSALAAALLLAGCQHKTETAATQPWINEGREIARAGQLHLQDISLAGSWACAPSSRATNADFYRVLQSGPITLLTDVAVARKLQASMIKMRYAAMSSPYVLTTPKGSAYLFLVENNSDNARFFSTRYNLAVWEPDAPMPGLFPLREMTLDHFKDNRITFKKDTGASSDDATCGPKSGSFFPN